jgi:DNA processing protein
MMISLLTFQQRIDAIRLYRSKSIGSASFYKFIEHFRCPSLALAAWQDSVLQKRLNPKEWIYSQKEAEDELFQADKMNAKILFFNDHNFPLALSSLKIVPFLYVLGHHHLLNKKIIAIVGGRNASIAGKNIARQLASDLSQETIAIVSGLARGIDTAAHEGSLKKGTIAVLAGGIDNIYPPQNTKLYHMICETGCVLSEMPPGTSPIASLFPRRNRIVAGLSLGVIVIEAALKSGSLITARLALDYGRDIFAVPGSPLDQRCHGSNDLIRQGAYLTESIDDILPHLSFVENHKPSRESLSSFNPNIIEQMNQDDGEDNEYDIVLSLLSPTPVTIDEILNQCHLSHSSLSSILLDLELKGRLEKHPGSKISLCK